MTNIDEEENEGIMAILAAIVVLVLLMIWYSGCH